MHYLYEHILPSVHHMKTPPRVLVAMSGGVDSSTVAYLFKSAGYDVIGVFIKMWYPEGEEWTNTRDNLCCDISTILGVRQVAAQLDIPLYILDMAQEFKEKVVDNYIEEYEQGRTPNPCSKCNKFIKLGFLWEKAQQYGAQFLATGHYVKSNATALLELKSQNSKVKIIESAGGQISYEHQEQEVVPPVKRGGATSDFALNKRADESPLEATKQPGIFRATDTKKDQTYFLWEIEKKVVPHLLFPLGTLTKPEVREIARQANLPVFDKEESQGTCFIVEKNNKKFLQVYAQRLTVPGDIVDERGNVLGQHRGLVFYTIGQREGLGDEVAGKYMKYQISNIKYQNEKLMSPVNGTVYSASPLNASMGDIDGEPILSAKRYSLNASIIDAPKLYVKKLDTAKNQLIVAENNELFGTKLQAKEINILDSRLSDLVGGEVYVQIRGGHKPDQARLVALDLDAGTFEVEFLEGVRAITPGQSAVLFEGDQLLGGGVII